MLGASATDLEVRVDGKVDPYERAMMRAEAATRRYERSLDSLNHDLLALERQLDNDVAKRVEAQHRAFEATGRGMIVAGGAMLAGAALSAKAAVQWETAWAGVTKTTTGTPRQMNQLEDSLRGLARTLPQTHQEIAGVAEAAGQLGVKRQDIAKFTKVMLDLGISTNLSSEEAATGLAQMMNVMGTAGNKVSNLGSALVALGNNGASTEADILHMAQRLTGAGKVVGMTEQGVLALASSMANLGIQSELGGGAMSRVLLIIDQAVRSGGDHLEAFAQIAGTTAQEFADQWSKNPTRAMDLFAQGMGRVNEKGGNLVQMLDDAGVKGTQNLQVILRLAGAHDEIGRNLDLANRSWTQNTALINEANKRYQTTASRMQIARNQIVDTGIALGQSLLPALGKTADFVGNLMTAFRGLPGPIKSIVGPLTAVMGAVTLAAGAMLLAVPKIAAFNAALDSGNLQGNTLRAGKALRGLAGFLGGPWGLAIGIGISALGVFAAKQGQAAQDVDALTSTLNDQNGAITENSRQWAIKKLSDEGALDAAKTLGLNLAQVTDAALGNKDAIAAVNDQLRIFKAQGAPEDDSGVWKGNGKAAKDLEGVLQSINGTVDESRTKWQLQHEAMGAAGEQTRKTAGASKDAVGAQKAMGSAAQDTVVDLNSEKSAAQQLQDAIEGLNNAQLGARAGARDFQAAIDDANKVLLKGKRTLDIHSKAGRENQAALDSIAEATLRWTSALAESDASGKRSWKVLKEGRDQLFEVARRFGMSKDAAHAYVDEVLAIPTEWKTQFDTPGIKNAQGEARNWRQLIDQIPTHHDTKANFDGKAAAAAAARMASQIANSIHGIPDEPVNITLSAQAKKVQDQLSRFGNKTFADGGAVNGPGTGTSDSIEARLSNGEHIITAEEVRKAGGHRVIEAFRRAAKRGELGKMGDLPAFADGGRVDVTPDMHEVGTIHSVGVINALVRAIANSASKELSAAASKALSAAPTGASLGTAGSLTPAQIVRGQMFARAQVGKPYIWGGVGPAGYDCSGAVSAVTNAALGRSPYSRLGSTASMPWPGWGLGVGRLSAGWFTGSPGHTAGNLGGLPFESAGGVGFRVGGAATSVGSFPHKMHLGVHDKGGWLKPGDVAFNGTKEPEPVLTSGQWDKLNELIADMRKHFGANSPHVKAVQEMRKELRQRAAITDRLAAQAFNMRQARVESGNSVRDKYMDNSSIFADGPDRALLHLQAQANDARSLAASLKVLQRKGLKGGAYQAVAENTDRWQAEQMASWSPAQVQQFNALFAARNAAAGALGNQVAAGQMSPKEKQIVDRLHRLDRTLDTLANRLENAVERGARAGAAEAARKTNVRRRT